jgi:excisionase family DNA binding protein
MKQPPLKPPAIDELLTCMQAAAWLQVHADTIRCWVLAGELRAFNVGSDRFPRYRIPKAAVLERFKVVRGLVLSRPAKGPRGAA